MSDCRRPVDKARRAALDVLTAVRTDDAYANLVLPQVLRKHGLQGRDAALATELSSGAIRMHGLYDAVIDACDQVSAKLAMASASMAAAWRLVTVGAAGGKRLAHLVDVDDLHATTHDPLLAQLRYRLRRQHGAAREGRIGVDCVFSREAVAPAPYFLMPLMKAAATAGWCARPR